MSFIDLLRGPQRIGRVLDAGHTYAAVANTVDDSIGRVSDAVEAMDSEGRTGMPYLEKQLQILKDNWVRLKEAADKVVEAARDASGLC